jgi:hypothetical protein
LRERRIYRRDELDIDPAVAPLFSPSTCIKLKALIIRLDESEAQVVTSLKNNLLAVDRASWLTGREQIRLKLVSHETFAALLAEVLLAKAV